MEYCWTLRGHNGNCSPNHAWESNWSFPLQNSFNYPPPPADADADSSVSAFHALMLHHQDKTKPHFFNPDPHLTCLKLGKRHYFEDGTPPPTPPAATEPFSMSKKGKSYAEGGQSAAVVPRCQVEGCAAVLVNAKDYHRRHKVCETHAKAPRVVVLGMEQRFCQQCSRFHGVAEFDEAKRSCRRRLAGHNERRRKSSQEQNALARRHSQGRYTQTELVNNSECALSLLSSNPWNGDLPARCSAALRELIAENRASILACRQIEEYKVGCSSSSSSIGGGPNPEGSHVTLNLMQPPNSAFGLLSMHDHNNKSSKEHCSDLWKLPLGY